MKKVICLLLAILSLVAVFMTPISAADVTRESAVMDDLSKLTIDGEPFSAADYPRDFEKEEMSLITVVEQGYSANSLKNFELFFYIYNPSCKYVKDDDLDSIVISTKTDFEADDVIYGYDGVGYEHYDIMICSRSSDDRFLKIRLVDVVGSDRYKKANLYSDSNYSRVYHISSIHLKIGERICPFSLGVTYNFEGYYGDSNTPLVAYDQELKNYKIELHPTSWVSSNAGTRISGGQADMFDHYEVSSVYFRLTKDIFSDGYTNVYGFNVEFEKIKLTPIVVTHDDRFIYAEGDSEKQIKKGETTKYRIENGLNVNIYDPDASSLDLIANYNSGTLGTYDGDWVYSDSSFTNGVVVSNGGISYSTLGWYFSLDELANASFDDFGKGNFDYGLMAVKSEQLRQYYYSKTKYGINPFIYYSSRDYVNTTLSMNSKKYNLTSYLSQKSSIEKFFLKWFYDRESYVFNEYAAKTVPPFTILDTDNTETTDLNESLQYWIDMDNKTLSETLYIGLNDVPAFKEQCRIAKDNNEMMVILHVGVTDYRCAPLYEVNEVQEFVPTCVGLAVSKWAFLNVNVYEALVMSTDGHKRSVPLVSNTVDIFGNVIIFENPNDDNGILVSDDPDVTDRFWDVLKWILIIILVIALLPVLIWVLGLIFGFIGKSADSTRRQIEKIKKRREERETKKKEKEAKKDDKKSE